MKVDRKITIKTNHFQLGDTISFTLNNGEKVEAFAVKDCSDKMLFLFRDCLKGKYPMNELNTNEGGYEQSYLRKELNNNIINLFPKKIRKKMVPFENGDLLTIPTKENIFGDYGNDENRFFGMKKQQNRVVDDYRWYWLQDTAYLTGFARVHSDGHAGSSGASGSCGVRLVFLIKNRSENESEE